MTPRATAWGLVLGALLWLALGRPTWPQLAGQGQALAGAALARVATPVTLVNGTPVPPPPSGGRAELWPGAAPCAGWHDGAIDWCSPEGTPVHAPAGGTLTQVGGYEDAMRYGAYVIIQADSGLEIYVGHLNHEDAAPGLAVGQRVEAGTVVGDLSEFGYSTPHTHVQLRRGGALVGPDVWWAEWEGR